MIRSTNNCRKYLLGFPAFYLVALISLVLSNPFAAKAKPDGPCIGCTITGPNPIQSGSTATYSLQGSCLTGAASWTVTNGFVNSYTSANASITFTGTGSAVITAKTPSGTLATLTITLTAPPPLYGGTLNSPVTQGLYSGQTAQELTATAGSGGSCGTGYTYTWYTSIDNSTFNLVAGVTSANYYPGTITQTLYVKRQTLCSGYTAWTSNTATITVYPPLGAGAVNPSSETINNNASAGTLSSVNVTGGAGAGSYTYQWYSSSTTSNFTAISGATGATYAPGNLSSTMYYEVAVTSAGRTLYSTYATVNVLPAVGGTINPSSQTINYNTIPGGFTVTPSGGNNSYSYQWYTNASGTYQSVSGATTPNYTPPALTANTSYEVVVTSNGAPATVGPVTVNVYPKLIGATVNPASETVYYNSGSGQITPLGASGGNSSYTYTWLTANAIGGPYTAVYTGNSFGIQSTDTVWIEVKTTSNGVSVTSSPGVVNVYPELIPGNITPGSLTVPANAEPGPMTALPATGGGCNGNYFYQWQSSPTTGIFSNIGGATSLTYDPGPLSSPMYYRLQVTCGPEVEYSDTINISIGTISNSSLNYIRERDVTRPGISDTVTADQLSSPYDVQQTTSYFDGLGRPLQTVAKQASPLQHDMVVMSAPDGFDREATKYLPYTSPTNDGNYKADPFGEQNNFYNGQFPGENSFYSQITYESSALNRPQKVFSPGSSWVGSDRGGQRQYVFNTVADSVQNWTINSGIGSLPVVGSPYVTGQLYKTVTTDETGHQEVQYTSPTGKLILKKTEAANNPGSGHSGWLCTYYVYDTLQNLRFIIQPKAVQQIIGTWAISQSLANELCFRYEYDAKERVIIKKAAGAGESWIVYDARGRVVMLQDSNLRTKGQWEVSTYDGLNRTDSMGLLTDPNNRAYHQNLAYNTIGYPAIGGNFELLTVNYYDNYNWVGSSGTSLGTTIASNYTGNGNIFITNYGSSPTYAVAVTPNYQTRGQITGTRSKVLGTTSQYLYSESFFDDRDRSIQTFSTNYTGAIDTITVQYDFSGKPLRTLNGHRKAGNTAQSHTVLTKLDYDHLGRLRHIWKNIDNAMSDQLIDSIQYNELGQVRGKYLGNGLDSLIYDYNIRGWLTGINKKYIAGNATGNYFGQELAYDKTTSATGTTSYAHAYYNGNIAGIIWKSAGDGIGRKYDYQYDNANRLLSAGFTQNTAGEQWDSSFINYSVSNLSYDANGNILSMNQSGFKVGGSSLIDQLIYSYLPSTNKLARIVDGANDANSKLGDFHYNPTTKDTADYKYDGNGSLVLDNNKAIDNISYNYIGQPTLVHMKKEGNICYTYDAYGHKIKKSITDSTAGRSTTILYLDGFVYQQLDTIINPGGGTDTLQFLMQEEGRVRWAFHKYLNGDSAYAWEYDFFEKDHQGNTRILLTQEKDTALYLATMETAFRNTESQLFYNLTNTGYARNQITGYPVDTTITNPNDSVARVNGNGNKVGPGIVLKVMSGDKIDIAVQSYYVNIVDTSSPSPSVTDVLNSLSTGLVAMTGGLHGSLADLDNTTNSPVYTALNSFMTANNPIPTGKPKAYLNWILLDDQFNYVSSYPQSGAAQVGAANQMNTLGYSGIPITKSGYLYVYVSNETPGWDAYFDNLSVKQYSGPLVEETHYYPFGLTMAGISDKAIKPKYAENKYKYNDGSELANKEFSDGTGLETYETSFRMQDPQIGRFWQMDPLKEMYNFVSPYQYALDNPVSMNDPTGAGPGSMQDIFNSLWYDADGDENDYGGTWQNTSNGGYDQMYESDEDAFSSTASSLYASGYFGNGAQAASNFQAAVANYNNVTGDDLSLNTPAVDIGYHGDRGWVTMNSWSLQNQLHANGAQYSGLEMWAQPGVETVSAFLDVTSFSRTVAGIAIVPFQAGSWVEKKALEDPAFIANALNPEAEARAVKAIGTIGKVADILGKALGAVAVADHSIQAYKAIQQGDYWKAALNGLKVLTDVAFMAAEADPIVLVGSLAYSAFDAATSD